MTDVNPQNHPTPVAYGGPGAPPAPNPAPGPTPGQFGDAGPKILDRGYRSYDGERLGQTGAMKSLFVATIQRALGLKRPFRFKIVPVLTAIIAYVPAIFFTGIAVFFANELMEDFRDSVIPTYPDFYGSINLAIILFVAFIGPEIMLTDRRTGMLGLYLASPLDRPTYLLSKVASMLTALMVVTVGPLLFLMIGFSLVEIGPESVGDALITLLRILGAGLALGIFYSAVALAVSSVTKRNGFASAGIIVLIIGSSILAAVVRDATDVGTWIDLFDLLALPFSVVQVIYGQPPGGEGGGFEEALSAPVAVAGFVAITLGCLALTAYRFFGTRVTK